MPTITVTVEGLPRLMQKLTPSYLYQPLAKRALEEMGKSAAGQARASAGGFRRTGALAGGIKHKLNAVPVPLWVAVTTDVRGKTGRRYAWILEFDGKYGHRNWFKNAVARGQRAAQGALSSLAGQIMGKWAS